mgnify:CR=1 FL=1
MPELLDALAGIADPVRPFERTAGDEVQGLVEDPGQVSDLIVHALRERRWWIGIGVGVRAVDVEVLELPMESYVETLGGFAGLRAVART